MRNLKKILALVLALVMSMSLMATANAAFTDEADITGAYDEAVQVMSALNVFKGMPDGSFAPQENINRAQVAAMVYRIATADVADKDVDIHAGYGAFEDVPSTSWAAGYIGYCANAKLITGYGNGKFGPFDDVTGYQALAMILRAIGYGREGEFQGKGWEIRTASLAESLGILKNIGTSARRLSEPATREMVAEILFQAILKPQASWTPALGYQPVYGVAKDSLAYESFKLLSDTVPTQDKWGRPGYDWKLDKATYDKKATASDTTLVTMTYVPTVTYTTAVTECDIAHDVGLTANKTYALYVNGLASTDTVQPLDTMDTMGAQGRLTEVYEDRIVMIDTFLANVVSVTEATYDNAGHLRIPATLTLDVYDGAATRYILTNGEDNYTYTAGQKILVNAYTNTGDRDGAGTVSKSWDNKGVYGEDLGVAEYFEGTQTLIWHNIGKHTVNGETYDDAAEFNHNEAGTTTKNYNWYMDQYGNLIGSFLVQTVYDYAVIKSIWWADNNADGIGEAMAKLQYFDGSENVVTVHQMNTAGAATMLTPTYSTDTNAMKTVGTTLQIANNAGTNALADNNDTNGIAAHVIDEHLFQVETLANGTVDLKRVWDMTTPNPATHTERTRATIINKYGYITSGAGSVAIDASTLFIVGTPNGAGVYTYTTYTGLNEVPSFTNAGGVDRRATVDYVLGAGGVADYVYIIGTPNNIMTYDFALVFGAAYTEVLLPTGGVDYYEVTMAVPAADGGVKTIKVQNMADVTKLITAAPSGAPSKLFYLTYTGDRVTRVVEVINNRNTLASEQPLVDANLNALRLLDAKMPTTQDNVVIEATVNPGSTTERFTVEAGVTQVIYGALADDMTDKDVYVVYNRTNKVIQKVYVVDRPTVPGGSDVTGLINAINLDVVKDASGAVPTAGLPIASMKLPVTAASAWIDNGTTVTSVGVTATLSNWKMSDGAGNFTLDAGTVFESGRNYEVTVTLTPANPNLYYINGTTAIRYDSANGLADDYFGSTFTLYFHIA